MRSSTALFSVILGLSLFSAPAFAGVWEDTFAVEAVDSWMDGEGLSLVLVNAGADEALAEAGTALAAALRETSSVKVVMDASALGDVSALGDAEIVEKAASLPVDQIAVLRVFPAGEGQSSAVVTLYDKSGAAVGGFSANSGEPLGAKEADTASAAASAVSAVTQTDTDLKAQIDEYLDRRVWFQGMAGIDSGTGQVVSTWSVPYKGRYQEKMTKPELYEYVGADEALAFYKKRLKTRRIMGFSSLGILAVGSIYHLQNYEDPFERYSNYDAISAANADVARKVVPLYVIGGLGLLIPPFISLDKTEQSERYQMVDEFNKELRVELGLPEDLNEIRHLLPNETDYSAPTVMFGVAPLEGGAAAGVHVTF